MEPTALLAIKTYKTVNFDASTVIQFPIWLSRVIQIKMIKNLKNVHIWVIKLEALFHDVHICLYLGQTMDFLLFYNLNLFDLSTYQILLGGKLFTGLIIGCPFRLAAHPVSNSPNPTHLVLPIKATSNSPCSHRRNPSLLRRRGGVVLLPMPSLSAPNMKP